MKNPFFNLALDRAARLTGKPGRLAKLLVQFAVKMKDTNWKGLSAIAMLEKFKLLRRMIEAHLKGRYKVRSLKVLLMLLAVVIYFVNPFDLIPDAIIGVGLADDFAVLTWFFSAAREEVNAFSAWESTQPVS